MKFILNDSHYFSEFDQGKGVYKRERKWRRQRGVGGMKNEEKNNRDSKKRYIQGNNRDIKKRKEEEKNKKENKKRNKQEKKRDSREQRNGQAHERDKGKKKRTK